MRIFKKFVVTIVFVLLLVSIAPAQEVVEKFTLGNIIESLTYISSGDHMGKFVVCDGWWVYTLDVDTRSYEKLFSCKDFGFDVSPRGISYISTGDFAGNFLLTDPSNATTLFIISYSGTLIAEVTAVDFSWDNHSEDITEITSGPFQGNFAMSGFSRPGFIPHIFIFSVVNEGGVVKAYLKRDIQNEHIGSFPLGLTFLPDDYPNPAFRNHLVIADLNADSGASSLTLRVIDDSGNMVANYPTDDMFEGFAYISNGTNQGKFIVSNYSVKNSRIQNIDGSLQEDLTQYMKLGFGLNASIMLSWVDDTNEFRIDVYTSDNLVNVSRNSPGNWTLSNVRYYHSIPYARDITKLTNDGKYYLMGFEIVGNIRKYIVQKLNSNFQLEETYILYDDHPGKRFSRICYIPGASPGEDKFALLQYYDGIQRVSEHNIYFFDKNFSDLPEIMPYDGEIKYGSDIVYDPEILRYYVLDADNIVNVYNKDWEKIVQIDISQFAPSFSGMTKITSGELKGDIALLNRSENELFIINITPQITAGEADILIINIQDSGILDELKTSLIIKLENAVKAIEKGNIGAAINKIGSFQNEVKAQSGKKIPEDIADIWLENSEVIIKYLKNNS